MFEENIKVRKYVLIILKTMQFCNFEICTNQSCARGRHVVDLSAITDICSMMGRGALFKILERNLSPEAISEHFCILIGETLKFLNYQSLN